MSTRLSLLVLVSFALSAGAASAGDVEILVRGCEPGAGPIRVAAFADAQAFAANRRLKGVEVPSSGEQVRVLLPGLPSGSYGFAAFQDTDGDQKTSKNFLGIPVERYGFSNGARGRFGPPDFEEMRVTVTEAPLTLEIEIE